MSDVNGVIRIIGAREHNLQNISLSLPRNRLIVVTGLSGSGKSSLAFDTLYAEGQRRYIESLSSYARQFLELMKKPLVESIDGLSPSISIEQRSSSHNPRSTVGTATEIHDYFRLLYARIGIPHCPRCGRAIERQSAEQIVEQLMHLPEGTPCSVLAPMVRGRKGEFKDLVSEIKRQGFLRVRVDGQVQELSAVGVLDKKRAHTLEVVVDRVTIRPASRARLTESIETALALGKGLVTVNDQIYSQAYGCVHCGINLPELEPRMFSFNSPFGACPDCDGIGTRMEMNPDLVIPDRRKSLADGAVEPWRRGGKRLVLHYRHLLRRLAQSHGIDLTVPFEDLPKKIQKLLLDGAPSEGFEGILVNLQRRLRRTESEYMRQELSKLLSLQPCLSCQGTRLRAESGAVRVGGMTLPSVSGRSISKTLAFLIGLKLNETDAQIAEPILKELTRRLSFLVDVGLEYLTLDRASHTLSGGEAQRIRLATQIGSALVGVLYILDEPSIGLHPRDNAKLLTTLRALRDLGNTLVVVEHDEETIRSADYIVDLGPGAGEHGGQVVYAGDIDGLLTCAGSLTGRYLRGDLSIPLPARRRRMDPARVLRILGASEHNLKQIDVTIPLGCFVCVTGVSGSGKSTLVDDILHRALRKRLHGAREKPGAHRKIEGAERLDKVIVIDQSPIGRTPRSNPATYTGLFSPIRDIFSRLPDSKIRGFSPGRFSFNVKGGRCETCQGDGIVKIEMHFLPDIFVTCEACSGKRFNQQTLAVRFKGKSIADVLELTVHEAQDLFQNIPGVRSKLEVLTEVGLGYIRLGQSATTLSGGEAQRIKLSTELSRRSTGRTFYILDEPTTGLHFADIQRLLTVLHALVDAGNTVLVIEHHLDVIKTADYLIDLGPDGGDRGGRLVAAGAPEAVANMAESYTGQCLRRVLGMG